jgi:hypothetical protein
MINLAYSGREGVPKGIVDLAYIENEILDYLS